MPDPVETRLRICPLCEATCGLELSITGRTVTRVRGDREDVFSHGYICPKGTTLKALHEAKLLRPELRSQMIEVAFASADPDLRLRYLDGLRMAGLEE